MPKFKPYRYEKDEPDDPFFRQVNWGFFGITRIFSSVLIFLGFFILLTQIILPIYVFKTDDFIDDPLADTVAGKVAGFSAFEFSELDSGRTDNESKNSNTPEYYYLSVPKLGIKDALVETNPDNLNPDEALGHYVGTAMPGETGNSFIYGHSVLPIFYNPRNYKSIFSTLGSLQTGDEVLVNYNNITYKYKVDAKAMQDPEIVDPMAKYRADYLNESTVTLMTCWPAGSKAKRLMVYAVKAED